MGLSTRHLVVLIVIILTASIGCAAQGLSKEALNKLFEDLAADEKAVAECEAVRLVEQTREFGKPLPKIAGHCWEGCPTLVPLPYYPKELRSLKIGGLVVVETVVDEDGNVVYANATKGSAFLRQYAVDAAYHSKYQGKITCKNRPIKFRWTIKYNFLPDVIRIYH